MDDIWFQQDGATCQTRWHGDQSGRWTYHLIPELATWLDRKHGQVGFYLAQALSGHGCFNAYLKPFTKRDDESCRYCGSLVDNSEHTLFVCARWGVAREAVGQAVSAQLTPDTMVSLMLQSEKMDAYRVIRHPGDGNNKGQQKSHRGLHSRSCVSVGLGCPRRSGKESFYSSHSWRGQSVFITGVWPRLGVPGKRMTEESYATLSWNQPPVKFKAERRFRGRYIG